MLLYAAYKTLQQATKTSDLVLAPFVAACAVGCLLGEPGPIAATSTCIVQRTLLGLRKKRISWTGPAVRYAPSLREELVIGNDGTSISHTQYHVGQAEFIQEVKRHGEYVHWPMRNRRRAGLLLAKAHITTAWREYAERGTTPPAVWDWFQNWFSHQRGCFHLCSISSAISINRASLIPVLCSTASG